MSEHFADRLLAAIDRKKSPTCVGLDPDYARLPAEIVEQSGLDDPSHGESALDAILEFCRNVLHVIAPLVPAVKINSAYFERYYSDGVEGYYELVEEAAALGLIVIGDIKRADIEHSSAMYANAHLGDSEFSDWGDLAAPDAVTVNPYFGLDGVRPFIDIARNTDRGVFVLVQTSNETAGEIQGLTLENGMKVAERVGVLVNQWAGDHGLVGRRGYSLVGAVVSPQDESAAIKLRALMPNCLFLIPGFGAQGRSARQVAPCFKPDGSGALVTASRSVIYAFEDMKYRESYASEWEKCVELACKDFVSAVASLRS